MGVRGGNVYDLTNAVHRTGLERDVLDTSLRETLDDLCSLLRRWNAGGNTKSFNREVFTTHLLPERKLEGKLAGVDVEGIQGDTNTGRDVGLDLGDFGSEGCRVIVTPSGQLDVVTGGEDSTHKSRPDRRRCHACDH